MMMGMNGKDVGRARWAGESSEDGESVRRVQSPLDMCWGHTV
jgi:hypothetical protein